MTGTSPEAIAIVLAGGRSQRMGRDKMELRRARIPLWRTVAEDAARHCAHVVVVGPTRPAPDLDARIAWTHEDPPGSGPVSAVAAGIAALPRPLLDDDAPITLIAGDAPEAGRAIPALLHALGTAGVDAAVLVDAEQRLQPLCAAYRAGALRRALDALGDPAGRSMHQVLAQLDIATVPDVWGAAHDIDTPEDAHRHDYR